MIEEFKSTKQTWSCEISLRILLNFHLAINIREVSFGKARRMNYYWTCIKYYPASIIWCITILIHLLRFLL